MHFDVCFNLSVCSDRLAASNNSRSITGSGFSAGFLFIPVDYITMARLSAALGGSVELQNIGCVQCRGTSRALLAGPYPNSFPLSDDGSMDGVRANRAVNRGTVFDFGRRLHLCTVIGSFAPWDHGPSSCH